jgi:methylated-DNA-[protein]-cysteine S-methyltransferase
MKQHYCLFETALGPCAIAWDEGEGRGARPVVIRLQLPEASAKLTEARIAKQTSADRSSEPPTEIARLIDKLRKHLDGEVQDFRDVAVDLGEAHGFALRVFEAARKVPAGQTTTYGGIARALGRPNAARAVGQAVGKNPIPIIIPCHRILGAGGKPGGFSAHGGLTTKARMLEAEGVSVDVKSAKKQKAR